ncbi:MAG: hypothetical protein OEV48_19040 [Acidobacteriota bacterium]|nr:hypothetical protein [Acidobacteriota bacterium]
MRHFPGALVAMPGGDHHQRGRQHILEAAYDSEPLLRVQRSMHFGQEVSPLVGVGVSGLVRPDVEFLAIGGVLDQSEAAAQHETGFPLVLLNPVFLGRDLPPRRFERDGFGSGDK